MHVHEVCPNPEGHDNHRCRLFRMTPGVRAVVARAYGLAQRDGLQQIGEDHLLWALLDDEQGGVLLAKVVGASERAQVANEMEQARRRGGLTEGEAQALAGFGIDVDAVVGQIEQQMGAGALAGSGPSPSRRWTGPVMSAPAVHPPIRQPATETLPSGPS